MISWKTLKKRAKKNIGGMFANIKQYQADAPKRRVMEIKRLKEETQMIKARRKLEMEKMALEKLKHKNRPEAFF